MSVLNSFFGGFKKGSESENNFGNRGEIAENRVKTNQSYIYDQFKKKGQTPQTQKTIIEEAKELILSDELNEYNERLKDYHDFIESERIKKNKLYEQMLEETNIQKKIYSDIIIKKLEDYLSFLDQESKYLETIQSELKSQNMNLESMHDIFSKNKDNLVNSINSVNEIETSFRNEMSKLIEDNKIKINGFFEEEKNKLGDKMSDITEDFKKMMKGHEKDLMKTLEKSLREKIEKMETVGNEHYKNMEEIINGRWKNILIEFFDFDWQNFVKYFFLFFLLIIVVTLDYVLVQEIMKDILHYDSTTATNMETLAYTIIPVVFSLGIIIGEIFNEKVIKYRAKPVFYLIRFLSLISIISVILLIIATDVIGKTSISTTLIRELLMDFTVRLIIFGISIPMVVVLFTSLVDFRGCVDFVKNLASLIIKTIQLPFAYIMHIYELTIVRFKKKDVFEKLKSEMDLKKILGLDLDNLSINLNDLQLDIKGGAMNKYIDIITTGQHFEQNIDQIDLKLNKLKNLISELTIHAQKGQEIVSKRMNNLGGIIDDINKKKDNEIQSITENIQANINDLEEYINSRKKQQSIRQKKLASIQNTIQLGLMSGLNYINNNKG